MKKIRLILCLLGLMLGNALWAQWSLLSRLTFVLASVNDTAKNCNVITGHGTFLYAGTGKGLLMSADAGLTWTNLTRGNVTTMAHDTVTSISFVNNGTSTIMMIGTTSTVYASTDNGVTWTQKATGMKPGTCIRAIVQSGTRILAAAQTAGGGVYVSDNYGTSWDSSNTGLDHQAVNCLLVDGSTIYAGEGAGVYKSTDNGATWTLKSTGLPASVFVYCMAKANSTLYAGSASGKAVWRSSNNGDSWDSVRTNLPASFCQVFGMVSANNVVHITQSGNSPGSMYYLEANSTTWVSDTIGLNDEGFFPALGRNEGTKLYIVSGNSAKVYEMVLTTGIQKLSGEITFEIYPNPAHTYVEIKSANFNSGTRVSLLDMSGRAISRSFGQSMIDLNDIPNGNYIVELSNEHGISRKLFVKE